jgi:hypothetical protein
VKYRIITIQRFSIAFAIAKGIKIIASNKDNGSSEWV